MYEEPYRWVEAVGNRRTYLDEQFRQGSPVVALGYDGGLLLTTVSKGTSKLYEIYDRIALGGMGHPADLEKLRFSLLEMAHTEGFNRSPSDVTGSRLVKYGIAPVIKQAFEEVYKAPFIVRIVLAELGQKPERDTLLTINYDGTFEELKEYAVLAATKQVQARMQEYLKAQKPSPCTLEQGLLLALRAWAIGSLAHQQDSAESSADGGQEASRETAASIPDQATLLAHLREVLADKTLECAVLERQQVGSSKYRALKSAELARLLPGDFQTVVSR